MTPDPAPLDLIAPRLHDLGGGFTVRRVLPSMRRQSVGPFVFLDHFGPHVTQPGDNHDVRPHPHIGLSTVSYLFEGEILHRDSIGAVQRIEPGAINWMCAGRGIVHSERLPPDRRDAPLRRHGLQLWCALPVDHEEDDPWFEHTPAEAIPSREADGVRLRVPVGEAHGLRSPVRTVSDTRLVEYRLAAGARQALPVSSADVELALYAVSDPVRLVADDGRAVVVEPFHLAVLPAGQAWSIDAAQQAVHAVLVGGAPLGARFIWWNFVSSRRERIHQAADEWERDALGQVPGETERIPLPEKRLS